ncbi:hypothetical protein M422DRAFT_39031 [Sphaerobolus stellatus SS14]|uniref:Unplaced genomic scaffold SPHSTscaffold_385, whole genome shotgun sequence n=1 Tax=Sphaerobolus stellatus (strain SS14) TaxID=990650 RepID=A0A0C9T718_SPHS4|nr:hypothetical protein M422DRAFT_39031 [Sphaerobolus stellatus SS14]
MSLSLQSLAEDSLVNSRLTVAALALQSYDILLTFNDEVKYIWRGKWTLIKSIYLVCRYVSFINLCCNVWKWTITVYVPPSIYICYLAEWYAFFDRWMSSTTVTSGNIILGLRLHNLYGKDVIVRVILILLFTILVFALNTGISPTRPSPLGPVGCLPVQRAGRFLITLAGAACLTLTYVSLILASKSFLSHVRERADLQSLRVIRENGRLSSLLALLHRDGVLIYVGWIVAIYSLACPRLILLLGGDPSNSTGVYKNGTEFLVDKPVTAPKLKPPKRLSGLDSFLPELDSISMKALAGGTDTTNVIPLSQFQSS